MTDSFAAGWRRRPDGPLPRLATAIALTGLAALCGCDRSGEPAADPAPFVLGLEAGGLAEVRYKAIRRDGPAYVLSEVKATHAGQPVGAREVRFEDVRSLSPFAAGRVVVSGLDAGEVKAEKVELGEFTPSGPSLARAAFSAEGFAGRVAGHPFTAARLSRDAGPQAAVRFSGLHLDVPPLAGRKDWDGMADLAGDGAGGTVRVSVLATAGEARLGLQASLVGYPPGIGPEALASWPFVPDEGRWDMVLVRSLSFRSEGLSAPAVALPGAPAGGPASTVADGLAKGLPVAVSYDQHSPVPLGVAWSSFLAAERQVPGLRGRVGDREFGAP